MKEIGFTTHANEMLVERNIDRKQVYLAVNEPDSIKENDGRVLRVVTNSENQIVKVITQFFDHRVGRKL